MFVAPNFNKNQPLSGETPRIGRLVGTFLPVCAVDLVLCESTQRFSWLPFSHALAEALQEDYVL